RSLIDLGWQVRADGQTVQQAGKVKFKVKSDIDWFDLEAQVDFDGHSVAFPTLLAALKRGDTTVRLDDGSLGIMPEEWLAQFGLLSGLGTKNEEGLRFSNNQAAILDALLAAEENVDYDDRFKSLSDQLRGFDGVELRREPHGFDGELRDYQKMGLGWLHFLKDFRFGGCLADDMGLGKTVQVLAMLSEYHMADSTLPPTLIVVPRSLMFNWSQECERFTPHLTVMEYTGADREELRPLFQKHNLVLTTYGTLRRDAVELREMDFSYIVLDEAQTIKNPASQVARASRLLKASHRIALSGTPIENSLGDLWSIFEFLNPGMLGRSKAFRDHTSNPEDTSSRAMLSRGLRPFILRRSKQQVAAELPEKLEETIYCEMEADQRKLYDELRVHYRDSLLGVIEKDGINKSRMHVLEALLRLRQAACHPALLDKHGEAEASAKLDYLCPRLEELIAEGHKALVFSQFTSMLSLVRTRLDDLGMQYEYLDGRTRNRKDCVNRFQTDDDCSVFLISLKAGGLGLNLTAADYVFLLDPWWNPAVEAQAVDRAHRVGQQRPVFAYRLICRDTVEEKIAQLQKKKRELADAIREADNSGILKDLSV
ncbi:MAG: DEAD/DEAH box helicase, partial [Planctomycetaceae bacterium]